MAAEANGNPVINSDERLLVSPHSALRLANPTSETTSLELAWLRRLSVPSAPTRISVVRKIKRFDELEDQLDTPVDHHTPKKQGKGKEKQLKKDVVINLQDTTIESNETAAKALLQISKETSSQLDKAGSNQGLEQYTPLTKAALEFFDMKAMKHMDQRELA